MVEYLVNAFLFVIGVLFLWKGADALVEGASKTAARLGISALLISLTIIAYGTSLPEFAVSVLASKSGHPHIALGNVLGSCLANLLLVLGLSALVRPLKVERAVMTREAPMMLAVTLLLLAVSLSRVVSQMNGMLFLALFALYISFCIRTARRERIANVSRNVSQNKALNIGLIIWGLVTVTLGAVLLIDSAVWLAQSFNIPEVLIALSVIAIGTSLPELAISSFAAYRKEAAISVGNVIGSNIFNILLVLGAAALITPIQIDFAALMTISFLILLIAIFIPLLCIRPEINRAAGAVLLLVYISYLIYIFG